MAENRRLLLLLPSGCATVTENPAEIRRLLPCYGCYRILYIHVRALTLSLFQGNKSNRVTNRSSSRAAAVTFRVRNGNKGNRFALGGGA